MPDTTQNGPAQIQTGISGSDTPSPSQYEGVSNPPQGGNVSQVSYSDDDYNAPIPQGATDAPGGDEYSTPIPQGATNSPNPDDTGFAPLDMATHAIEGVGASVGKTILGAISAVTPAGTKADKFIQDLRQQAGATESQDTASKIGGGLGTVAEFMLGDEALKGLSMAERLTKITPVMKLLEKMPSLQKALQLGINVGKAGIELGPEERAAIQKYPILARLVGAGLDAVRQGGVQAVQTGAESGNVNPMTPEGRTNLAKAGTEGATMAGVSAGIGGGLGVAGGLLNKGAQAAEKVGGIQAGVAANAPTTAELNQGFSEGITGALQPQIDAAQAAKEGAEQTISEAGQNVGQLAANAPEHAAITSAAQTAVKNAHTALGDAFEAGRDQLTSAAGDTTIPHADSPLQTAAADLLGQGKAQAHPLDEAFNQTRPGSARANDMLDKLTDPYGENELKDLAKETDETGAPTPKAAEAQAKLAEIEQAKTEKPITWSMEQLLDRRKLLNERLRKTGWTTDEQRADRDIYHKLIDGVDSSIEQLAQSSGNPDAMNIVQKMNADYKTGITRFKNPDVQGLLTGNVNDVAKRLMGGGTSVADINTVRDAIGKDAFGKLADDSLRRLVGDAVDSKTGEFSFQNFFRKWGNIPAQVRDAMFKDAASRGVIEDAINKTQSVNAAGTIPESEETIKKVTKTISDLVGNGDVASLVKDPERINAISAVVGPKAMGDLGNLLLQNQMRIASTDAAGNIGPINAGKVLDFVASLKDSPEVLNSLFKPTPESAAAYNRVIGDLKQVQGVKNMIKLGIIAPTLAAGGIAGHFLGSALLGTVAAGSGEIAARNLIEQIANHPNMWRTLQALDTAAKLPTAKLAGTAVKAVVGKGAGAATNALRQSLNSTSSSLQ